MTDPITPDVRPDRETIARAIDPRPSDPAHTPIGWSRPTIEAARARTLTQADGVLALWPGESRDTVQAEALRDAADAVTEIDGRRDDTAARWLRARADRLEGGTTP